MNLKLNSRYNYPQMPGITFTKPTRTQQQFGRESDINEIVKRAIATGDTAIFTPDQRAEFYDCSSFDDYQSSVNFLNDINDDFYSLPADVRREFADNPSKYIAFVVNPDNFARCVELGIFQGSGKEQTPASANAPEQPPAGPPEEKQPGSDA
jgi:Chlamydia-phage Chp2 scaffold (Chlamy_scaf).